jgi:hypothetical protein
MTLALRQRLQRISDVTVIKGDRLAQQAPQQAFKMGRHCVIELTAARAMSICGGSCKPLTSVFELGGESSDGFLELFLVKMIKHSLILLAYRSIEGERDPLNHALDRQSVFVANARPLPPSPGLRSFGNNSTGGYASNGEQHFTRSPSKQKGRNKQADTGDG